MSQIGVSRPASQQAFGGPGKLPEIRHPLSRLDHPGALDVRGHSRGGPADRPVSTLSLGEGRPLNENPFGSPRRSLASSRGRVASRLSRSYDQPPVAAVRCDAIPENVEVTAGDPAKTRLPVFGNRTGAASREGSAHALETRVQSRLSTASAQARLEIDELESMLKERVNNCYHELKKRFKDNDPEQKGNVSRDGLFRILVTFLGRPLTTSQFSRLLDRLGFPGRQVIPFPEFFARFREAASSEYPRWMDPVQRQWQERATMTAAQVHAHLQDKARQRVLDLADLVPQCNPDGSGRILKAELQNSLNKLGFFMDPDEFEKLWARYDPNNDNTINGEVMMQRLGISINGAPQVRAGAGTGSAGRPLRKKEQERQRSLDIEKWLKRKFREGFSNMKHQFEACDKTKSGTVSHAEFLKVLSEAGLHLEKEHLAEFLARCSVQPDRTSVPYREFLHRFLDRSEAGMAHNVLTNQKHRYNRPDSPGASSTFSALEAQLINMFQRDFLALLGTFHKIDKLGLDYISQQEFRAAIESRFELEMTEEQFGVFLDKVPLDHEGNVRYADFMAQFDTKGKAPSLFDINPVPKKRIFVGALPRDKTPSPPPGMLGDDEVNLLIIREEEDMMAEHAVRRSPQEIFKIIKDLLKKDYQAVEEAFYDIDEMNTGRFSQDTMFKLLKRFDVEPDVTRGEIRDLWKTFITNQDKTLDFHEFTRHFGYSLRSAAFPNAKIVPPRRGDCDFMMRSRKLNCASDMLQDTLRAKVDYMWQDVYQELSAMDKYETGAVSSEEFKAVLTELCVNLSNYEIDLITNKFRLQDGRVSYTEFLKPFAMKRQVWRHGNNMLSLLQHPNPAMQSVDPVEHQHVSPQSVTTRLGQKLSGEYKHVRRAFKRLDVNNEGLVSLADFRAALRQVNVSPNDEDVFQILEKFDPSMTGKINYQLFLQETCKPTNLRESPLRHSANI